MSKHLIILGVLGVAACSDPVVPEREAKTSESKAAEDQGKVRISTRLKGTLYFNYAAPMEAPRAMALDLRKKRYRVVSDGIDPAVGGKTLAFVDFCSPLAVQLAVQDEDGFKSPISECVERDSIGRRDLYGAAVSPDGKRVAVTNFELYGETDKDEDPYGLMSMVGATRYTATQVYNLDGKLLGQFDGYGPATWTKDGQLIIAGMGDDVGYGVFMASKNLKTVKRVDDGRLKGGIQDIDAHPSKNEVVFIHNGQIFEMSLSSGKPKRIHAHGHTLSSLAFSPKGDQIAFISTDTLDEAIQMEGSGYPIFVYDNGDVHSVRLPFVVAGQLEWTD